MRLLRYGPVGGERPGLLDADGTVRDLSGQLADIDGSALAPDALARLAAIDPKTLPAVRGDIRIGPPVASVGKLVCVGLNYEDHARETGQPIPSEPVLFMKATTAIVGPNDDVVIPQGSEKTDWEVELAIVMGRRASYVSVAQAMDYVAGFTLFNDVSERHFQLEGTGQWVKGKSADSFAPMGPFVATKDEIADVGELGMWLEVDGKRYQDGSTRTMIFDCATIVSYISRHMTLMPGDVIPTGTPPGVGAGLNPQVFLRPGQTMRLGIDGLGEQRQKVVAYPG